MRTSPLLHYLCTWLLLAESTEAQLLPKPRLASKFQLPNLTFKRGNAFMHYLGSVVATTAEGSLVRVDPSDRAIIFAFTPDRLAGRDLSSPSGIALLRGDLAIYSVIDAATDDAETTSRVLCVNLKEGTLVWSTSVSGRVIGTPQISEDHVYVVHNTNVGGVTIFKVADGEEPANVGSFITEDTTLGPASLVSVDKQDVLAVASNRDNGFSAEGGLYMLIEQQAENNEKQGGGGGKQGGNKQTRSTVFRFINVSTFLRSSVTAPLLSGNMELVVGEQGASLTAFAGKDDLSDVLLADFKDDNMSPSWQRFVDENPEDGDAPILSTPIFSVTGELVYIASAGPQFAAVMLQDGSSAWSVDTENIIETSPVLGEDVVYTIESNGRVSQYDAIAGDVKWVMGCDVAGTCDSRVEADFVLSDTGNELYFGDTNGIIMSVTVGGDSTSVPTSSPVLRQSDVPTRSPTEKTKTTNVPVKLESRSPFAADATAAPISVSPTVGSRIPGEVDQQNPNNDEKKTSGYLAAGVVSVAAFIVAFAICFVCRRNATSKKDLNSELKTQQLAYEQACRNAEKEALEEIMRDRRNEELMEQSATETFFYGDQTLATPMSMPGMSIPGIYQKNGENYEDSDYDSEEQIGFEVTDGDKQVSPVFARPADSPEKMSSKVSKSQISSDPSARHTPEKMSSKILSSQISSDSSARHTPLAPSADIENGIEDDEEPGRIVFREKNDAEANESQRPPSPAYSDIMSDDDSLYTTEEQNPIVARYLSDDPKQTIGRSFSKDSSYPDDETSKASAFPGISSYFRSPSKKPTSPEAATDTLGPEVNASRTLAHAGVSVRQAPSKSRAGLFSRRSAAVVNKTSPKNATPARNNDTTEASRIANHSPAETKQTYEAFKPEHIPVPAPPPQDPVSDPPPQDPASEPLSEEDEKPSPSSDVWNSFLSELAKAEKSFFGSSDKISRPPSPPPPPPPPDRANSPPPTPPSSNGNDRSAGTSSSIATNRTKSPDGGNKGYFWV